jgi:hypothetical protein
MHPILIVGAVLAGLPIVLHLIMKREPKRLPFPALRFLKQRHKTNQRKLRLRHFVLLLMRMLLIGLFALALYQPTLETSGAWLSGEQPIAAVMIVDTTPSMGLRIADKSRLDDARSRALALLEDLPPGSKVAVLDTADPKGTGWEVSVADARRRLEGYTQPRGGGQPVTAALAAAYQLLTTADAEFDTSDDLSIPKLVAVFSDRTPASWEAGRTDELVQQRETVPPPAVAHLYADVGASNPADVAITDAAFRPQAIPQNQPATVVATVQCTGVDLPAAVVRCRLNGMGIPERKEVTNLRIGSPQPITFTFRDLKPGFHQVELSLETDDAFMANNVRYATVHVLEARKVLTITDNPSDADFWKLAIDGKQDFLCEVATPGTAGDFRGYEVVCLLGVADPGRPLPGGKTLWEKLSEFVAQGGRVLVIPGPNPILTAYDTGQGLLPGKLTQPIESPTGASWVTDEKALRHPLIAPFRGWKTLNVDFLKNPRKAWKFWGVEAPQEHIIVSYDDDTDPMQRSPAVLERVFPSGGKVVMLTVPMDPQDDPTRRWHNYWELAESSWSVVFPNLLIGYLAGTNSDANFQYTTGQFVTIPLPRPSEGQPLKLVLEGPGVVGPDATTTIAENQTSYRLPMDRSLTAGNYLLRTEDRSWASGFSLNPPAEEFDLSQIPVETIEAVCGPGSVVPAGKELEFRKALDLKFNQPLELFSWLLLAVLMLFCVEGLVSNRFYRSRGE